MARAPSVFLLELNELSPPLMDRFIAEGALPNFARLRGESFVFTSEAEERPPYLEPWIQWITVHSGVPYDGHKIFNLGDGNKLPEKCVWDLLSDAGFRVWVCGSMNIRFDRPINGWVLPDPWAKDLAPFPGDLEPYYKFVRQNVQEYTNDRVPLTPADYARFLWFMARHGLSPQTALAIGKQLLDERRDGAARWKRAMILDLLQFDVFRAVYRRTRPQFSTYFANSTAHFQHMYWRNLQPELFSVRPSAEDQAAHEGAIRAGYQSMDRLLGEMLDVVGPDTTVVFATALSQQPCLKYEAEGGRSFYRPREFADLLAFLGVKGEVAPVMSQQFHILFDTVPAAEQCEALLRSFKVDGEPGMYVTREGNDVFAGCSLRTVIPEGAVMTIDGKSAPFYSVFYKVEGTKSGMHHPDGLLWIRTPSRVHRVHPDKVPLARVAPTLLELFAVKKPGYMKGEPLPLGDAPSPPRVAAAG